MSDRRRLCLYLLLSAALLVSGLPAHGTGMAMDSDTANSAQIESDPAPGMRDCPMHGAAGAADKLSTAVEAEPDEASCCDQECQCACAGLSPVLHARTDYLDHLLQSQAPDHPVATLPSQPGDSLLRPPQA